MIRYDESFKARCKAAFPEWKTMHDMLDEGDGAVGRALEDSGGLYGIAATDVVKAIEQGPTHPLYAKVKNRAEIDSLYSEWSQIRSGNNHP